MNYQKVLTRFLSYGEKRGGDILEFDREEGESFIEDFSKEVEIPYEGGVEYDISTIKEDSESDEEFDEPEIPTESVDDWLVSADSSEDNIVGGAETVIDKLEKMSAGNPAPTGPAINMEAEGGLEIITGGYEDSGLEPITIEEVSGAAEKKKTASRKKASKIHKDTRSSQEPKDTIEDPVTTLPKLYISKPKNMDFLNTDKVFHEISGSGTRADFIDIDNLLREYNF